MSDLPNGWRAVRLDELGDVRLGRQRSPARATGPHMRPYMRAANVGWDGLRLDDVKEMDFDPKEFEAYGLRDGDILVGEASGSRDEVGKSAVWRGQVPGACFQNTLIRVRVRNDNPDYVQQHLKFDALRGALADVSRGVGIHHLGREGLANWTIGLPPRDQQRRIVEKIEALTAKSRRAKEALDAIPPLLERFRQSVLAAAFRGDLTKDWREQNPDVESADQLLARIRRERRARWEQAELERLRAKGKVPKNDEWKRKYVEPQRVSVDDLPGLPDGWCWAGFGELCDSIEGGTTVPPIAQTTAYPVLRSSSVRVGTVDFGDVRWLPAEIGRAESKVLRDGDLLFTRLSGSIEYVANCACIRGLGDSWLAYPDRLFCAKLVEQRLAEFAELVFSMPFIHRAITAHAKSTAGHQRISISNLGAQPVPLAPLAEQQAMVAMVRAQLGLAARVSEAVRAGAARLDSLGQSVLAQAFRGELV